MLPLVTTGVSDDVAQELQMPIAPQVKDPGTLDQTVLDQHSLTHLASQPWCKLCVESRGARLSTSRAVEKRRSGATTSV